MRGKKQGNVSCHGWLVQASKGICKRNGARRYLENCILKKIEVLQKCASRGSRVRISPSPLPVTILAWVYRKGKPWYLENCILKKIEVLQKCNIQTSRSTPAESWRSISKRSKKRQMHGACILVTLYQCAGKSQDWFTGEGS